MALGQRRGIAGGHVRDAAAGSSAKPPDADATTAAPAAIASRRDHRRALMTAAGAAATAPRRRRRSARAGCARHGQLAAKVGGDTEALQLGVAAQLRSGPAPATTKERRGQLGDRGDDNVSAFDGPSRPTKTTRG